MAKRTRDLPSTIRRSEEHAQAVYGDTLESAIGTYGDGERAHRTAFSALKHQYEKVGDHWEPKQEKGPSDAGAAERGADHPDPTAGGVDANASKAHLLELARRLQIPGRSRMTKDDLVRALQHANDRATRAARSDG